MKRHTGNSRCMALAAGLLFVAGCSWTQHHALAGRDIDAQTVQEIAPGVTTKADIENRFGKPDKVVNKPEGEEYLYTYRGLVEKTNELGLYAKKTTTDERKTLRIIFDNDVVKQFSYTNSNHPEENLSKQS
jgi:outer membrane protein assembly factor BamE (lipoprotein component of BamABCDE complex)